jgi:hypothetical protein
MYGPSIEYYNQYTLTSLILKVQTTSTFSYQNPYSYFVRKYDIAPFGTGFAGEISGKLRGQIIKIPPRM